MNTLPSSTSLAERPSFNPWPYSLAAFLILFGSGVIGFGFFAIRHHQDLVRPDYYEYEVRYQEQIDRMARTRALEEPIGIALANEGRTLKIQVPAGAQGIVHLYRPADARLDREIPLMVDAEGRQQLELEGFKAGLWKVRVHWWRDGADYYRDATVILPER